MFRRFAVVTVAALVISGAAATSASASPPPDDAGVGTSVYTGTVTQEGLSDIADLVDRHEIVSAPGDAPGEVDVQVVLNEVQAAALREQGTSLEPKAPAAQRRLMEATPEGVFRTYGGEGGIREELMDQAATHPGIAQFRVIGETWQGQEIGAVRVTGNIAKQKTDGKRPATVYVGAQHAREWITPEMVRRLLDYYLSSYGTDPRVTGIIDSTELWFVPVANPDGYDFTFQDGNRLWRKNLRDNDGDGEITGFDGVDLNRNSATRWGYDNEGSSPNPVSDTYRGPSPGSEPETQALDQLFAKVTPQFLINYHSAAELLLYGIGWQVATPSPDDVIYEAMAGDDATPAVPGYDPDISAELYTTNGDLDTHMQERYGALGFTPEMSTCEAAADSVPDDEWVAEDDCVAFGFDFPDDEALIQAEFEKNIPFALAVAESALDPDDPVSVVGRDAEDFRVDSFSVSYGDPQTVAVWAKRALKAKTMYYSVDGGKAKKAKLEEWSGGERYGFENTDYYAEYRGVVTGTAPGDRVEVWFEGQSTGADLPKGQKPGKVESAHFTYEVAQDTAHSVLIVANEDYTGYNPEDEPRDDGLKYLDEHVAALQANGVTPDVWDVDAQGVPHDLGVLGHYDAVLWYLGDNRLTQDEEDVLTEYGSGQYPDLSVAERQQYLTIAMRDYLNEGGKLALAGETVGYYGLLGASLGGIYYGLDGAPDQQCMVTVDPTSDCLLLADDFTQYWMGAYDRAPLGASGINGVADPLAGLQAAFGGPATEDNPIDEVGEFTPTSEVLPVDQFPQFESWGAAEYTDPFGPFIPIEGEWAAFAGHIDDGYQRLGRTFTVPELADGETATFDAQISYATEFGYDNVIVEVRPAGTEEWTTLPDLNGGTSSEPPTECEAGFYVEEHPQLENYLTVADPCLSTGATGEWNAFTGSSGGWTDVSFDLSAYEGQEIELVISYVTDPFTGDTGLIVDDVRFTVAGAETEAEGFEAGLGAWTVLGAPDSSPGNSGDWERVSVGGPYFGVTATPDTLLFGFGLEQLSTDGERAAAVGRILDHFGL
ncbi:M14 family metallopeptidase [Microbacterium sp. BK668]|uniref:M14 family metallopeptidase n=1 Tax=Microbacterium sp. BK668 TaxID=2512118 RepID=UPI00105E984D|nr:M14 family metallopeptidase [Microbacterium sp. BK668]TDN91162.1 immune inhibitor A peptidase M6 [Microbacterium sp. BK668]